MNVGQAGYFIGRLSGHERWGEAENLGMNQIHLFTERTPYLRDTIEGNREKKERSLQPRQISTGIVGKESRKKHEKKEQNRKYNIALLVSVIAVIIAALSLYFVLN